MQAQVGITGTDVSQVWVVKASRWFRLSHGADSTSFCGYCDVFFKLTEMMALIASGLVLQNCTTFSLSPVGGSVRRTMSLKRACGNALATSRCPVRPLWTTELKVQASSFRTGNQPVCSAKDLFAREELCEERQQRSTKTRCSLHFPAPFIIWPFDDDALTALVLVSFWRWYIYGAYPESDASGTLPWPTVLWQ